LITPAGPGFLKVNSLSMPGFNLQLFGLTGKADMEVTTESLDWSSWNSITCYPRLPGGAGRNGRIKTKINTNPDFQEF